jgi:hypothetical protein
LTSFSWKLFATKSIYDNLCYDLTKNGSKSIQYALK